MSTTEQAPGGVYVSRPNGESGIQPSLVTSFSPDHPGHPDKQPASADPTQVDVASKLPAGALRVRYEQFSRAVINQLIVDPLQRQDAVDRLDELLICIDMHEFVPLRSADAVQAEGDGSVAQQAAPSPSEPALAFEPPPPLAPPPESEATTDQARGFVPPPQVPAPDAAPEANPTPAPDEAAPATPAEDGDEAKLVEDIREDLQEAEEKLEKLQQRQGKKIADKTTK